MGKLAGTRVGRDAPHMIRRQLRTFDNTGLKYTMHRQEREQVSMHCREQVWNYIRTTNKLRERVRLWESIWQGIRT